MVVRVKTFAQPEQEKDPAPIELTCFIEGRSFAFEHTGVEPFEGQIDIEAKALFEPLRDALSGEVPPNEQYELCIPASVAGGLTKAGIRSINSVLGVWIRTEVSGLQLAPIGRYGIHALRPPDNVIPFEIALYRSRLPGVGHLSIVHVVDDLDKSLTARIERACKMKFPKLAIWKGRGARTVLILEGSDDQLTNPVDVAREVLRAEKIIGNEPEEIYFLFSLIVPWWVWHVRVGTRSFFDLNNPDDRAWEVDPETLYSLTNR